MKRTLLVEGMSCEHCEKAVKNSLGRLDGVSRVEVNLAAKKVEVEGNDLVDELLKEAIEDAGYDVLEFI